MNENKKNYIDDEEYFIPAKLDLTNKPIGRYYFNKNNNYEYTNNWYNYDKFYTLADGSIVGDVVQTSGPRLKLNSLDNSKKYTIESNYLATDGNAFLTTTGINYNEPIFGGPSSFYPTTYNYTVGYDPGDDFNDISVAIATVPAGSYILIKPGTYFNNFLSLLINKYLIIWADLNYPKPLIYTASPFKITVPSVGIYGLDIFQLNNAPAIEIYDDITPSAPFGVIIDHCTLRAEFVCAIRMCVISAQISNCIFNIPDNLIFSLYNTIKLIEITGMQGQSWIYNNVFHSDRILEDYAICIFLGTYYNTPDEYYSGNLYLIGNRDTDDGTLYQFMGQKNFAGIPNQFNIICGLNISKNIIDAFIFFYLTETNDYGGDIIEELNLFGNVLCNKGLLGIASVDGTPTFAFPTSIKRIFRTTTLPVSLDSNTLLVYAWKVTSVVFSQSTSPEYNGGNRKGAWVSFQPPVFNNEQYSFGFNTLNIEPITLSINVTSEQDVYTTDSITPERYSLADYTTSICQSGNYNKTSTATLYSIPQGLLPTPTAEGTYGLMPETSSFISFYKTNYDPFLYTYNLEPDWLLYIVRNPPFGNMINNKIAITKLLGIKYSVSLGCFTNIFTSFIPKVKDISGITVFTSPYSISGVSDRLFILSLNFFAFNNWIATIENTKCISDQMSMDVDKKDSSIYVTFMFDSDKNIIFHNSDNSITLPNFNAEIGPVRTYIGLVKYDQYGFGVWATKLTGNFTLNSVNNLKMLQGPPENIPNSTQEKCLILTGSYSLFDKIYDSPGQTDSDITSFSLTQPTYYSWTKRQDIKKWVTICTDWYTGSYISAGIEEGYYYVSKDKGIKWVTYDFFSDVGIIGGGIFKMRCNSTGLTKLLITQTGELYVCPFGETFGDNDTPFPNPWYQITFAVVPLTVNRSITSGWISVSMSSRYGLGITTGLNYIFVLDLFGNIQPGPPQAYKCNSPFIVWSSVYVGSDITGILVSGVACSPGYHIYFSNSNYFKNWIELTGSPKLLWSGVCCDETGQHIYACTTGLYIYSSHDYGVTWQQDNSGKQTWKDICCSNSGQYIAATIQNGQIWISDDYGITWLPSEQDRNWSDISCARLSNNPLGLYYACVYESRLFFPLGFQVEYSFIIKYDTSGKVQWVNNISGGHNFLEAPCLYGGHIQGDSYTYLYVTGCYANDIEIYNANNLDYPLFYLLKNVNNSETDVFIIKFNLSDGSCLWKTSISSYNLPYYSLNQSTDISVDDSDCLYITGFYTSQLALYNSDSFQGTLLDLDCDVYPQPNEYSSPDNVPNGSKNVFVISYYSNGSVKTKTFFNGTGIEIGQSLAIANLSPNTYGNPLISGIWENMFSDLVAFSKNIPVYQFYNSLNYEGYLPTQNAFLFLYKNEKDEDFIPIVPEFVNTSDPFPVKFNLGGSTRLLTDLGPVDTPIETWGGITGWTAGYTNIDDINTGVICKYGHDVGNTRILVRGLPSQTIKNYSHISLQLLIEDFPTNDPEPITQTAIPYGFVQAYIICPGMGSIANPWYCSFNNIFNDNRNLVLKSQNWSSPTPLTIPILGIKAGDVIRIGGITSSGTKYLTLTVKEVNELKQIGTFNVYGWSIVFEESTSYAYSVWKERAYISPILDPISPYYEDYQLYLIPFWYRPNVIKSGTLSTNVQIFPKEYSTGQQELSTLSELFYTTSYISSALPFPENL